MHGTEWTSGRKLKHCVRDSRQMCVQGGLPAIVHSYLSISVFTTKGQRLPAAVAEHGFSHTDTVFIARLTNTIVPLSQQTICMTADTAVLPY